LGDAAVESQFVFTTQLGTPIHPRNDYRSFQQLLKRAGLRKVRLHDLRHTAASLLLAQGVPARVVMEILGHSQISITLNTYTHVDTTLTRTAADRMEEALWPAQND
jgi:integrase